MRESLLDVVIEPQRQALIPGFADVKAAALAAGALGCSISGAGPTVFAWAEEPTAKAVRAAMVAAFARHGLETDAWVSTIDPAGARIVGRTDALRQHARPYRTVVALGLAIAARPGAATAGSTCRSRCPRSRSTRWRRDR